MKAFPNALDTLQTVAAAVLDVRGTLLEANAGFLRLLPPTVTHPIGAGLAECFVQPPFAALVAAAEVEGRDGHRGLMTIGDRAGKLRTLRGRAWQSAKAIHVLAEYDVEELERFGEAVLDLNCESALLHHAVARANVSLRRRGDQIEAAMLTDALTGVGNRRRLDRGLAMEISRIRSVGGTLSAIMVDIDHFKSVNDRHGHAAGDKVLVEVGALLESLTRSTDIVVRFGGEEFVALLPGTSLADAISKAEELRSALATARIEPLTKPLTASFGVAEIARGEGGESFLSRADAALYEAKGAGRNRVVAARPATMASIQSSALSTAHTRQTEVT